MTTIVVPMVGKSQFFPEDSFPFPKPLIEFCGKTLIEHFIQNIIDLDSNLKFVFMLDANDCRKYHLDDTIKLLIPNNVEIIKIESETKGALCTSLLAINNIENEKPLVILNYDQIFCCDLKTLYKKIRDSDCDSAVITFESIHPRWSYAVVDENDFVVECAEKRPISKEAIAGFYYYSKGSLFINSAMVAIAKNAMTNNQFFISASLNELILLRKKLRRFRIKTIDYHTFYSPKKVADYEQFFSSKN